MKRLFLIAFCFTAFASAAWSQQPGSPGAAAALMKGLIIQPSMLDFALSANETGSKKITIMNNTPATIQLRMYLNDWERDSVGKHAYYTAGSRPYSCAPWVKLEKDFIEVPPGAQLPFEVTLRMPESADMTKDMKWAMLFVEVVKERKVQTDSSLQSQINPVYRMGVHIYETPATVQRRELKMVGFTRTSPLTDTSVIYTVAVKNEGDVQLRCQSSLEITNLTTGVKTKLGPGLIPLFPGQKRNISYELPRSLPKGKYSLLAVVDGGDDLPIEAAQGEVELK